MQKDAERWSKMKKEEERGRKRKKDEERWRKIKKEKVKWKKMKKDQGIIPFIMQMTVFVRLPKRRGLRPSLTMDSLLASFAILAAVTIYNKSVANINVNKDEENAFFLPLVCMGKRKKEQACCRVLTHL